MITLVICTYQARILKWLVSVDEAHSGESALALSQFHGARRGSFSSLPELDQSARLFVNAYLMSKHATSGPMDQFLISVSMYTIYSISLSLYILFSAT